jgi:hypothetical protein
MSELCVYRTPVMKVSAVGLKLRGDVKCFFAVLRWAAWRSSPRAPCGTGWPGAEEEESRRSGKQELRGWPET